QVGVHDDVDVLRSRTGTGEGRDEVEVEVVPRAHRRTRLVAADPRVDQDVLPSAAHQPRLHGHLDHLPLVVEVVGGETGAVLLPDRGGDAGEELFGREDGAVHLFDAGDGHIADGDLIHRDPFVAGSPPAWALGPRTTTPPCSYPQQRQCPP